MSGKLTKHAFAGLVRDNREWLIANSPDSLERQHILMILDHSVSANYPSADPARSALVEALKGACNALDHLASGIAREDGDGMTRDGAAKYAADKYERTHAALLAAGEGL